MFSLCSSAALCAFLSITSLSSVWAAPAPAAVPQAVTTGTPYWLADTALHGAFNVYGQASGNGYELYRNVMSFGAKGDGVTDDTAAINNAISSGNRCGLGTCNSSTISPAIVYFPPGKYMVSTPLIQYYYTQMIGDPNDLPTIAGLSNFQGIALIDSDPYEANGVNWYVNQNNFFRQVRNFNIDLTGMGNTGSGIHWQVAQATSLQNLNFKMNVGSQQNGIFMDNGSGGFMSDLTFVGGNYGAFFGNQQFTSRNMMFTNCATAIYMNFNWGWTLHNITVIGNGGSSVGLDMSNNPSDQNDGSVVLSDSKMTGVAYGVKSAYTLSGNNPATGGTLAIDNVDLSGATVAAIAGANNNVILAPSKVTSWVSGNVYHDSATGKSQAGELATAPTKNSGLLDGNGNIFAQSKPQYANLPASSFITAASQGAKGDGVTDDTAAVQALVNKVANTNNVAYFNYGAYKITKTITVPPNVKIVGECWPLILASGFTNVANPSPVFQIGTSGQSGSFQMSDMLFSILGPNPGAILIEYNLASTQGQSGIWDTHARVGGSYNSGLQFSQCAASTSTNVNTGCEGAFLMFYATSKASNLYLENTWFWNADHDMDDPANRQISVYNGRGVLIQAQGPVWLWGTASEHSIIYNYQFDGVQALFAGFIQTETPYFQPNPQVPKPFTFNSAFDDPTFADCTSSSPASCLDAWGLRVVNSNNVLIYSTGFYSFFQNYGQTCVNNNNCQQNMIRIQNSQVSMYAVSTKASVNMIYDDNSGQVVLVEDSANRDVFCATVGYYASAPS